jgi:hypothetical protein
MPIRKNRLNRSEQAEYLAAAQQLQSQGVAIEVPEAWREQAEAVDVVIDPTSIIYVLAPGQVLYALYVRMVSSINNFSLVAFDIVVDWEQCIDCTRDLPPYEFGPRGSVKFEEADVLNPRLSRTLHFKRKGDRFEGWLLGGGLRPVPNQYGPERPAPLLLRLLDSEDRPFDTKARVGVDRVAKVADKAVPNARGTNRLERVASTSPGPGQPVRVPKEV